MAHDTVSEAVMASYVLVPSQAIGQINSWAATCIQGTSSRQLLHPGRWRRM